MNVLKWLANSFSIAVALFCAASSVKAQSVDFSFDSSDSSLGAGLYAFDLQVGPSQSVPTVGVLSVYCGFLIQGLPNVAPFQTGAEMIPESTSIWLGDSSLLSPGGFQLTWYNDDPSDLANDVVYALGTPDLNGTLLWKLEINGNLNSGYVNIIPEPEQYGLLSAAMLMVGMAVACRKRRQKLVS